MLVITTFNMEFMQTALMNKYLVWLSNTQGAYVRADKVVETNTDILFVMCDSVVDTIVSKYDKSKIVEYKLVE